MSYGLGKCKCGKDAIIKINDEPRCKEHMGTDFKKIGDAARKGVYYLGY